MRDPLEVLCRRGLGYAERKDWELFLCMLDQNCQQLLVPLRQAHAGNESERR